MHVRVRTSHAGPTALDGPVSDGNFLGVSTTLGGGHASKEACEVDIAVQTSQVRSSTLACPVLGPTRPQVMGREPLAGGRPPSLLRPSLVLCTPGFPTKGQIVNVLSSVVHPVSVTDTQAYPGSSKEATDSM